MSLRESENNVRVPPALSPAIDNSIELAMAARRKQEEAATTGTTSSEVRARIRFVTGQVGSVERRNRRRRRRRMSRRMSRRRAANVLECVNGTAGRAIALAI